MKEMKYVVVRNEETYKETIFLFDKMYQHDRFHEALSTIRIYTEIGKFEWKHQYQHIVSAGFTNGITCYGGSQTLDVDARPEEDTALLLGL